MKYRAEVTEVNPEVNPEVIKKKMKKELYSIDKKQWNNHTKKMKELLKENGLRFLISGLREGPMAPLLPESGASGNTTLADIKTINALKFFFCLIGDAESSIILMDCPPEKCPSMSDESLSLFLKYKNPTNKGEVLRDFNGKLY